MAKEMSEILIEVFALIVNVVHVYIQIIKELFTGRPRKSVAGQVVVITGAGHGLGRELALAFSRLGAKLALIDVNKDNNEEVAREVNRSGRSEALAFQCDVRSEEAVKKVFEKIVKEYSTIDIVVNNAGVVQCQPIEKLQPSSIARTFEVNVFAHFWTIRAALDCFREQNKGGHIVAISSIAGVLGTPNLVDYCASKHAVVGLMRSLDRELHGKGLNEHIKLTTICPLTISTGMFEKPRSKFEWIFPVCTPEFVAEKTVEAVLTERSLVSVPWTGELFQRISTLAPIKVQNLVQDFFEYGVEPHSTKLD